MKKNYLFIIIFIWYATPTAILGNSLPFNSCNLPGVNSLLFFPFGQKNNDTKIACIQEGLSDIELVSFKLPVDRADIGRLELPQLSLSSLLGESIILFTEMIHSYSDQKEIKDIVCIPKLLFFKKNIHSIIGIELHFPQKEQNIFKIQRIVLFFMQNITKHDADERGHVLGFNRLAIYNADEIDNEMIIISETDEQKQEMHELITLLFKSIITAHTHYITASVLSVLQSIIESLAENSIGLIIEEVDRVHNAVARYNAIGDVGSLLLDDQEYVFYNPINKKALHLIEAIQKNNIPLTSNYYLYGIIMGYHEKFITFRYQLEAYLRSINYINADGTVRLPYNIPEWVKKNKDALDTWVNNRWNAPYHFFYPKERKQYEHDKKKAQKYLKHLPAFFIH